MTDKSLRSESSGVDQEGSTARTGANAGTFLRAALSPHDVVSPCAPYELRALADQMEQDLIDGEHQWSEPEWRYVDGLRALASALELAVDPSRSTPKTNPDDA